MTRKTTIKKIMSFGLLDRNEANEAVDMMHVLGFTNRGALIICARAAKMGEQFGFDAVIDEYYKEEIK